MLNKIVATCVGFSCAVWLAGSVAAQRPTAPQLFSDTTFLYARVDDTTELALKWNQTTMGKLLADPQVSPLMEEIYGSLLESSKRFEDRFDMTLSDALSIPNGEAAVAVMPGFPDSPPTLCLMVEAKGNIEGLTQFLDMLLKEQSTSADVIREVQGIKVHDRMPNASPNTGFAYFIDQDVLVCGNSSEHIEYCARVWQGLEPDHKPLASKSEFVEILSRCAGSQGERPQLSFYVDPLAGIKEVSKDNPGAPFIFAMLPPLGIDGIKGLGGSIILAPEDFDSISHFHLLLSSPRRVILSAIRPAEGPTDPETWVSEDVASYMTVNWKTQPTIQAIRELVDTFRGPDSFENDFIKRVSDELKLDFQKDVLGQLDDRLSMASVFVRPLRINSQSNIYAIKLKDPSKFENDTLPKIVSYIKSKDPKFVEIDRGLRRIYHRPQNQRDNAPRIPDPAFTVLDGRFMVADSLQALEQVCDTYDSGANLLMESLEYKVIKQRISSQVQGLKLCGLSMSRPEESLRTFYDMASDPKNRERLAEFSESNPMLKALNAGLTKHQLPPFDVIRKHMTPTGGFLSEDDSGLHFTSFSIKRK